MREWLELTLISHSDDEILLLETALEMAGAVAISYQSADESEIFEPPVGSTPMWSATGVTGLFPLETNPEEVITLLKQALGEDYPINQHFLADSDWVRAWLDHFRPIQFSEQFWVAATEHVIEDENAIVLRLEPGLAFGTGTHPSTAMCLSWLVNEGHVHGKTVYDYGCGSGILGIGAALSGALQVYQTDIDPQALMASEENAIKNHVADKITLCPSPDQAPVVDILVANILLEPLCALRTQFEKHLKPDSTLLFAGVLSRQVADIQAHYADAYHIEVINQREDWVLLKLHAKA